eukprot:gnl/TRDRNA2_/TRDRNA2_169678_c5_seq1.p1 gnl/TRDRNA2_/TRDRNA2_169678_c5~~gnl/TRDRNA2_/TRDRNA2_169678_c5_seq1.p1  ORF type:complete len:100 (+),score=3.82 gnl/TRDRNA2_/TRDRNA2_169678_c5_seq1:15-314(+)
MAVYRMLALTNRPGERSKEQAASRLRQSAATAARSLAFGRLPAIAHCCSFLVGGYQQLDLSPTDRIRVVLVNARRITERLFVRICALKSRDPSSHEIGR